MRRRRANIKVLQCHAVALDDEDDDEDGDDDDAGVAGTRAA